MTDFEDAQGAQRNAAAERVHARVAERQETIAVLQEEGGIAKADSPQRIAKRLDRLTRYYGGEPLPRTQADTPTAEPEEVLADAMRRAASPVAAAVSEQAPTETAGIVLEKIINTADFVDIRYLERGVAAGRAVCRVQINDQRGRFLGHGTGSLVSPRLVLTNHHVLENAEIARASAVEFNFQDGLDGKQLESRSFALDPDSFFLADRERDFALVAVRASAAELGEFGFNPLIGAEGKAIVGEFVTIVQHPRGEKKRVSLRENKIVDLPETFMHYAADTEPGSSGSPVFNDQWEVVALHHASVRAPAQVELGGFVNEGIRISRILAFINAQDLPPAQHALLDELGMERSGAPQVATALAATDGRPPAAPQPSQTQARIGVPAGTVVTLPLEISVRIAAPEPPSAAELAAPAEPSITEAIRIDPDYANRRGYDPDFLGSQSLRVPLPALADELLARALTTPASGEPRVLTYHHFSVVMNAERRLALFTAVNIDGRQSQRLKREPDRWFLDPRIPVAAQTGEQVYADNDLDRGHLVRRLDPAWGPTERDAKRGNDDSFHFTNCSPQHKDFNQRQTSWAGLEDYVLENADNRDLKVSVFTGPVFAADDDEYREVRLPRQFWKVVVMVKETGQLSATGYLLSQESLLAGLETAKEFSYGAYRTFQVPIARIESLTQLSFGELAQLDPLAGLEATTTAREVSRPEDLVL